MPACPLHLFARSYLCTPTEASSLAIPVFPPDLYPSRFESLHPLSAFFTSQLALTDDTGRQLQQLGEACMVIEALEPAVKEDAVRALCGKEITAYTQIFVSSGETAKLDRMERRRENGWHSRVGGLE